MPAVGKSLRKMNSFAHLDQKEAIKEGEK